MAFHVAFMSHGAAAPFRKPLKMLGSDLQHMQHETGAR